jgi:hypothetical protein
MLQVLLEKPVLASSEQAGSTDSGCVNATVNLTAPVTVRVAVNWWLPPDIGADVGFAAWLVEPGALVEPASAGPFVAGAAVVDELHAAITSAAPARINPNRRI